MSVDIGAMKIFIVGAAGGNYRAKQTSWRLDTRAGRSLAAHGFDALAIALHGGYFVQRSTIKRQGAANFKKTGLGGQQFGIHPFAV